jgi:hypothetical protein
MSPKGRKGTEMCVEEVNVSLRRGMEESPGEPSSANTRAWRILERILGIKEPLAEFFGACSELVLSDSDGQTVLTSPGPGSGPKTVSVASGCVFQAENVGTVPKLLK